MDVPRMRVQLLLTQIPRIRQEIKKYNNCSSVWRLPGEVLQVTGGK
jgi:hypothetical protein